MNATLIVIVGPTAVGKTALAIALAKKFNTEIISTDSRQFYAEMNIGTAKPSAEELAAVRHHFIGHCSVNTYYSAGDFERDALAKLDELFMQHKIVIAVGGSGLYVKALCHGLDEMPAANLELRKELTAQFEKNGLAWLQNELKRLDQHKYEMLDIKNPQRLMRAIELFHQGGIVKKEKAVRPFNIVKIGINLPREKLYHRINQRVMDMMDAGLEKEAQCLYPLRNLNALQTVGYSELFDAFEGKYSVEKAVELIKQHTRNYAKRQITWFKADPDVIWFDAENQAETERWADGLS